MPTILTHPAVPLALGLALGPRVVPPRLLALGVVASVLPDLDVLAFRFGIPYAHDLGHRGASHSLVFAALLGLMAWAVARPLRASRKTAFLFIFAAAASHGLLDMLTNGGLGVALAWPFSDERIFFPAQVIEASPLGLRRFLGPAGAKVMVSELAWVWAPCAVVATVGWWARARMPSSATSSSGALGAWLAWALILTLTAALGWGLQWMFFAHAGDDPRAYLLRWPVLWVLYFLTSHAIVENLARLKVARNE